MCLQHVKCFHQYLLSLSFGVFSVPLLFKDRKILNKVSTNGSTGSREKGLLRDIKLSLGDSGTQEEDPEQNQLRVSNVTQVSSSALRCKHLTFYQKNTKSYLQCVLF